MNRTIRTAAAVMGIVFAISGMSHGFFETLQGSTPTNGVIIDAISESTRTWVHGGETAFTIIPNFLLTGIAAIAVSIAIIIWSLRFLDSRHGATVFVLLFILLFLVGGGIGQVPFFLVVWAFATRINAPLTWWGRVLPEGTRRLLSPLWVWSLAASVLLFLFALEIAIFGVVPGVSDADQRLTVVFVSLGIGLLTIILSFVSAIARDVQQRMTAQQPARIHA